MKLFRKVFVLALAFVAVLVLSACGGKTRTLRVGTPKMSGDFVAGFSNSAYDRYVRDLIHGYGTLVEDEFGELFGTLLYYRMANNNKMNKETRHRFVLQDDLNGTTEKESPKDYVAKCYYILQRIGYPFHNSYCRYRSCWYTKFSKGEPKI